ncbi:serine/threonine protein kinase [Aldersonia sp. NBC_00410]|uniref:serine/threonine-protein kinase n=1 Tax=Aldersonia sp. NBC_00410 TaxID=2975954 RepID=UPI002258758A|nr:serine/threonine-protein kinase [Aldersonia sp. NBC_00410]MCX5043222.1 serine/threonine protein kinase [Aldersonia sp. NBC_00410]
METLANTGSGGGTATALVVPDRRGATGGGDLDGALEIIDAGARIDDFDLLTALGRGAFARVFLARQRSMQRLVAVKISHNHGSEPQTLAHLDHDHIVRVFDQRLIEHDRLKLVYMQYVPGGTLLGVLRRVRDTPPHARTGQLLLDAIDAELADRGGIRPSESRSRADIAGLSWPEAVAWLGRRLADALDYANRRGVLHRDIKPANVLLTAEGAPKLADFNISFDEHVHDAHPLRYFGGSLSYMSPEQLAAAHPDRSGSAADLDTRSDLYALAVMLWELLTGRRPFGADADEPDPGPAGLPTAIDHQLALRDRPIEDRVLADLPPDCPAALRRVLLSCLAPDPADRPERGRELATQLDLCLDVRARNLVDPPARSWQRRLAPWTVVVATLAGAVGNFGAVLYNNNHNGRLIDPALTAEQHHSLETIGNFVDWPFYPIVFGLLLYLGRHAILVPHGLRHGRRYDQRTLARTRANILTVGDRASLIGFAGWVVAGTVFVTGLLVVGDLPPTMLLHLLVTLVVCGAISVSYPFFLVTFWCVRVEYPTLLRHGRGHLTADDARRLHALGGRATVYLGIAAAVPMIAVLAGVSFLLPGQLPLIIGPMRWLCVCAVAAFVVVYWLFRTLEADLRALQRVVAAGV